MSQHTDTSKYMKACSVSQHTNTSKYTKATLKWCCSPHIYMAWRLSSVTISPLRNSIHPSEMEINPPKAEYGCPGGGVRRKKRGGGRLRGWGGGGGCLTPSPIILWNALVSLQCITIGYRLSRRAVIWGPLATTATTTAEIQRAHRLHRQHKKQSNVMLSGEIQFKEAGSLLAQPLDATQSEGR